jgi:hypothetical protein
MAKGKRNRGRASVRSSASSVTRSPSRSANRTAPAKAGKPRTPVGGTVHRDEIRAQRIRRTLVALGVVLALVAASVVLVWVHRLSAEERLLLSQAAAAHAQAGCTDVRTTAPYPGNLDRTHVGSGGPVPTQPPLSTYPTTPPASGPHASVTVGAGVYATSPSIGGAIHSLEHGAVIVWLAPTGLGTPEAERIETFFGRSNERNHLVVAPFDYPEEGAAGTLPAGRQMALVAWHRLQLCDRTSLAVAFAFVERFRFNLWRRGSYRGEAPEKYSPI